MRFVEHYIFNVFVGLFRYSRHELFYRPCNDTCTHWNRFWFPVVIMTIYYARIFGFVRSQFRSAQRFISFRRSVYCPSSSMVLFFFSAIRIYFLILLLFCGQVFLALSQYFGVTPFWPIIFYFQRFFFNLTKDSTKISESTVHLQGKYFRKFNLFH